MTYFTGKVSQEAIGRYMVRLKRIVLDVLKPHHPSILEFAQAIAALGGDYRVQLKVEEVDDKTESVILEVGAPDIDLEAIHGVINQLGGSLHSIDEVEVAGEAVSAETPEQAP